MRIDRKVHLTAEGEEVPVLEDLAFDLEADAFTCMIGPSGCGKTTALRILMGLDRAFEGRIDPGLAAARVGAAFQEPRLLPWRTIRQNVCLALAGRADADRLADQALADVGLIGLAGRYPAQLSLGQARRAALARAFAVRPDVLFLDEPFVSLDEATAQRLRQLLLDLWRRHTVTILMVTHNVREAVQLADRIVLLSERPARVAGRVAVPLPRDGREAAAVSAVSEDLARRFPGLVTI